MTWLATEDVTYGTRVLSLASAGDAIVPAPRSALTGAQNRVLAPRGWNAHAALVRSEDARAHTHAFLRDSAPSCGGAWDVVGSISGAAVDLAERHAGDALGALEPPGAVPLVRAVGWVGARARDAVGWVGARARDALGWATGRSRDALRWLGERYRDVAGVASAARAGTERLGGIGAGMSELSRRAGA
jgi:hypothetical protein